MKIKERERLVELFKIYCSDSIEHNWCDKHDCDYCPVNSTITDMLANIDSIAEETEEQKGEF